MFHWTKTANTELQIARAQLFFLKLEYKNFLGNSHTSLEHFIRHTNTGSELLESPLRTLLMSNVWKNCWTHHKKFCPDGRSWIKGKNITTFRVFVWCLMLVLFQTSALVEKPLECSTVTHKKRYKSTFALSVVTFFSTEYIFKTVKGFLWNRLF